MLASAAGRGQDGARSLGPGLSSAPPGCQHARRLRASTVAGPGGPWLNEPVGVPPGAEAAVGRRFVRLLTAGGCPAGTCQALTAAQPAAISNYSRVRATPLVLGALLALLAVALIAQALLTTARRRRRDFAIVKALGFLRRQVAATVAWQASTLAALALAVGLPLGVAGGRWAWAWFASSVGVGPGATVPVTAVALAIPVTLLLANLVAAVPGTAAARTRPAVTLRTE